MRESEWIRLVEALVWPSLLALLVAVFYRHLHAILVALHKRVEAGAELATPWLSVGALPTHLGPAEEDGPVSEEHLALIHTSWRMPAKDAEFGRPMFCFHAFIQAHEDVLDRIEAVTYRLHDTYPNPVRTVTDRQTRFRLKELAWGESTLHAEVQVSGQQETISLSRYINLEG